MTIRVIRRNEVAPVTELYLEMCRLLAEVDSDWGVPDWDPIHRWILRTTESDDAVCLVSEVDGVIIGFLLGFSRSPPSDARSAWHARGGPRPPRAGGRETEAGVGRGRNHLGTQSRGQPDPDDGRGGFPVGR